MRVCPETGHEELIVLAGYCNNVLAPMNPHRLDLNTWQWVKEPGLVAKPGPADATALPTPRQRTASETVGKKWLLLMGGSPTQVYHSHAQAYRPASVAYCLSPLSPSSSSVVCCGCCWQLPLQQSVWDYRYCFWLALCCGIDLSFLASFLTFSAGCCYAEIAIFSINCPLQIRLPDLPEGTHAQKAA